MCDVEQRSATTRPHNLISDVASKTEIPITTSPFHMASVHSLHDSRKARPCGCREERPALNIVNTQRPASEARRLREGGTEGTAVQVPEIANGTERTCVLTVLASICKGPGTHMVP
ncbi:hypothetical protein AcW1_000887 [Taiwanofungus camphoratus]|nr:hypothetical protein AcV5_004791 [Antrodia cinnamomea]KAI0963945.1 hypothetical protein AcW1_000887 [Antrodia cinnamomea]